MNAEKIIHKWFWAWDFEREEQWLNTMAHTGWLLDSVGFCTYRFIPCPAEEYTVRMEMHAWDEDYLRFMEETGAEYLGRMATWIYFRKKTSDGVFDLFSDMDSRIGHLNRIGKLLAAVGVANLLIGLANTLSSAWNLGWINLLVATVLMYGLGRIHGKKEALQAKRLLWE